MWWGYFGSFKWWNETIPVHIAWRFESLFLTLKLFESLKLAAQERRVIFVPASYESSLVRSLCIDTLKPLYEDLGFTIRDSRAMEKDYHKNLQLDEPFDMVSWTGIDKDRNFIHQTDQGVCEAVELSLVYGTRPLLDNVEPIKNWAKKLSKIKVNNKPNTSLLSPITRLVADTNDTTLITEFVLEYQQEFNEWYQVLESVWYDLDQLRDEKDAVTQMKLVISRLKQPSLEINKLYKSARNDLGKKVFRRLTIETIAPLSLSFYTMTFDTAFTTVLAIWLAKLGVDGLGKVWEEYEDYREKMSELSSKPGMAFFDTLRSLSVWKKL